MSATKNAVPSGVSRMSCGIEPLGRATVSTMAWVWLSTLRSWPENSQVTRNHRSSADQSAWFTPRHGTGTDCWSAQVLGS